MQMILNELSAGFPVKSVEDGKKLMSSFLETYFQVRKMIKNDSMLLDRDYQSFELAYGYRIEQWRNDPNVDVEEKRKFRTLINQSVVYSSEEFEQERPFDFQTEFRYNERSSIGCLLAYEMDGVAVSFLSDVHWKISEIVGIYMELAEDGQLNQQQIRIPNVSYPENVRVFKNYVEQKKEERRYIDILNGQDILRCAEEVFPNLVLCENAVNGCRQKVGIAEAGQVYKRLLELQRAAESMQNKFDKNSLTKATPESEATLKRFADEHMFRLPEGNVQLFSWHIRYTGGYAGRIFFYPVPEKKLIYIGHIGAKLPTVKYH